MNYSRGIQRIALVIYLVWATVILGVMWLLSYSYPMELYWISPLSGLLLPLIPLKDEDTDLVRSFHSKTFNDYGATFGSFIMAAFLITATFVYPWAQMHLPAKASGTLVILVWAAPFLTSLITLLAGSMISTLFRFVADGFRQD